jgi:hypothetical protein
VNDDGKGFKTNGGAFSGPPPTKPLAVVVTRDPPDLQFHLRARQKQRERALDALRGKFSPHDTFLRARIALEQDLDAITAQRKKLAADEYDKDLSKDTRAITDALIKLVHEMRGLEKDAYFAATNLSRAEKIKVMVEFFRELPKDEKKTAIHEMQSIYRGKL